MFYQIDWNSYQMYADKAQSYEWASITSSVCDLYPWPSILPTKFIHVQEAETVNKIIYFEKSFEI